jgi:hypothetical protein
MPENTQAGGISLGWQPLFARDDDTEQARWDADEAGSDFSQPLNKEALGERKAPGRCLSQGVCHESPPL